MAKTSTSKPIVLRVPTPSPATRAKVAGVARRGYSAAARVASQERHTLVAIGSAAVLGYMKKQGVALPKIAALGTPGTYGLIAFAIGRFTRSPIAQHVATGLMSVSAYELASGQTLSGEVMGNVMGEDAGSL
jgi:hypothetical protein